jgi:hypothetical protein
LHATSHIHERKKPEENFNSEENQIEDLSSQQKSGREPDGETVLSKKLDNPYSASNMQAAKANLVQRNVKDASTINVRKTKKYIRFLPQSIAELDQIQEDLPNLALFDTPMDRKIVSKGTW